MDAQAKEIKNKVMCETDSKFRLGVNYIQM